MAKKQQPTALTAIRKTYPSGTRYLLVSAGDSSVCMVDVSPEGFTPRWGRKPRTTLTEAVRDAIRARLRMGERDLNVLRQWLALPVEPPK